MDLFNKTFFRFAFGFIGIILASVAIIVVANAMGAKQGGDTACVGNCAK